MKVVDIANQIYLELGSPTSTSIPTIAFWIRSKVGDINNLLFEDFELSNEYEIVDADGVEITPEAVSIIKKLYMVHDYNIQIRAHMTSISTDTVLEVNDAGSSVKKINRNEVSKTIATLRNMEEQALRDLVTAYRMRGASPKQITGDDTVVGYYGESTIMDLRIV
jgi:hypothetical protein